MYLRCFSLTKNLVCKIFGPKIRSCKFFDKSQVCNLQQTKSNKITGQLLQGAQIKLLGAHNGDGNRHCAEHTTNCCQRWIRSEWFGLLT